MGNHADPNGGSSTCRAGLISRADCDPYEPSYDDITVCDGNIWAASSPFYMTQASRQARPHVLRCAVSLNASVGQDGPPDA